MQRPNDNDLKPKRVSLTSYIDLETTSSSSSSSSSDNAITADMNSIEIPESDLSDSDQTAETDYDEKIRAKEQALREVDLYLTKLQDRRKQLVEECNKLKDERDLRQSNKLAKQNWDSGECDWVYNKRRIPKHSWHFGVSRRCISVELWNSINFEECLQIVVVQAAAVEML